MEKIFQNRFVDGSKAGFRLFTTKAVQGKVYSKTQDHLHQTTTEYAKGDYDLAIYNLHIL